MMRLFRLLTLTAAGVFMTAGLIAAHAQDSPNRKELKRVDLSGAPGMEVISSIVEFQPGDISAQHFHHGIESGYVIQGGMIQMPGKEPTMMETGAPILNLRDALHSGFKVVSDKPIKLFTVHIVDKGKPLYAPPPAAPAKK